MKIKNLGTDRVDTAARVFRPTSRFDRTGQLEQLTAEIEAIQEAFGKLIEYLMEKHDLSVIDAQTIIGNWDTLAVEPELVATPPSTSSPADFDDDIPF